MKKILIIDNGGTVSMKRIEGSLRSVDGKEDIRRSIFELKESIMLFYTKVNQVDSTNLYPPTMKNVFDAVFENYSAYDGFVVLTGTDTLAYLASFMSFWLSGISRPVVITGSQKPLNMLGSDAPGNIYYSILFACEDIPEVAVFFNNRLFRGNRVKKVDSQGFDVFDSPNYLPIGHVDALRLRIHKPLESLIHSSGTENFRYAWSDRVHVSLLYPGFSPALLDALAGMGYRGLVIEAFGMGNLPNEGPYSLGPPIKNLVEKGILAGITSQCLRGAARVEYETARTFKDLDVMFLRDMTTEAAYAKMSFLLGLSDDPSWVRREMTRPMAGEVTEEDGD